MNTTRNNLFRFGLILAIVFSVAGMAQASPLAATAPGLGAAGSYSILGAAGVTDTGTSVYSGDVGPASSGILATQVGGVLNAPVGNALLDAAAADLALTAQGPGTVASVSGITPPFLPGVYSIGAATLNGVLTLDGPGIYIFLASALVGTGGNVSLINGARACDVFWHVTSGATFTGTQMVGTIIAGAGVTWTAGSNLNGRAISLAASVTTDNTGVSGPSCAPAGAGESSGSSRASYVSVSSVCVDGGGIEVTVKISDNVVVSGLGEDITSPDNNFVVVRKLPAGKYAWHATPPEGHYMQDNPDGDVTSAICAPVVGEASPLLPNTGADLYNVAGQLVASVILCFLSLCLIVISKRKTAK